MKNLSGVIVAHDPAAVLLVLPHPDRAPGSNNWEVRLQARDDVDLGALARLLRSVADDLAAQAAK